MPTGNPDGAPAQMTKLEGLGSDMSETEAAEEILKRFLPDPDAEKLSKGEGDDNNSERKPEDKKDDKSSADDEEKPEDEESDKDKGDEDEESEEDGESETVVKIKVGDEEHEVPVSKLTRLYGQEAALTKKSMEVAEQRKTVEKELALNAASNKALLERAKARFEPYSKLDFNLLAAQVGKGELSTEDYQALRQYAQALHDDVQFLEKHQNDFWNAMQERRTTEVREQAKACLKELSDPEKGIPGWDEKLYDDIRAFAVSQGASVETVNAIVEPWAFRLMHAAMLHTRGKSQVKTVKKNNTPKKIIKTSERAEPKRGDGSDDAKVTKAKERMQTYGSTDDVAEFLLARHNASRRSAED
jgi:hypothetical protein